MSLFMNFIEEILSKVEIVARLSQQSLETEHGIKSLSTILA